MTEYKEAGINIMVYGTLDPEKPHCSTRNINGGFLDDKIIKETEELATKVAMSLPEGSTDLEISIKYNRMLPEKN